MRGFLIVAVIVGLGILFVRQRHNDTAAREQIQAPAIASPSPAAKTWPKSSIDRAREVATHAQAQRKAAENP